MSIQFDGNVNSAFVSGALTIQRASDGITQNSISLAQQQTDQREPRQEQAETAKLSERVPSTGNGSVTDSLAGLTLNLRHAEAGAKVLDMTSDMVGSLINEVA
ncbi:hypothetical protein [Bowmanella dokdonensis]|uniref:Uncharacterized protein n=1 Tax=Bowmanella dokdonensis TaxID=751969 RepID=A0A939DJD9_9ALTE|nr:hypothetical protein [Bowmanella dokdonensis]MBN7823625.1 hypothetical protein [Bowmanella dokdonensis]